jgi:hypothetical protein
MTPEEAVRKLTEDGVIVTPEIMKRITSGDMSDLDAASPEHNRESSPKLSVKIRNIDGPDTMSPKDFIDYYNNRFESLKEIILGKMDAVSINKISEGQPASVIGMVRERTSHGYIIEDATGDTEIVTNEPLLQDDVIGARGTMREGKVMVSGIVWPDVPPDNPLVAPHDMPLLLADRLDGGIVGMLDQFGVVFVRNPPVPQDAGKNVMSDLPNPCHATIKKDGMKMPVLIFRPSEPVSPRDALGMLKRRHLLPKKNEIRSAIDHYVIDPVPGLFWIISNQRHVERYNGIVMVMSKDGDVVKYDPDTGEAFFANETKTKADNAPDQPGPSK